VTALPIIVLSESKVDLFSNKYLLPAKLLGAIDQSDNATYKNRLQKQAVF
jgi:hypothetical protein